MLITDHTIVKLLELVKEDDLQNCALRLGIEIEALSTTVGYKRIEKFVDEANKSGKITLLLKSIDRKYSDKPIREISEKISRNDSLSSLILGAIIGFITNVVTGLLFGQFTFDYFGIVVGVFVMFVFIFAVIVVLRRQLDKQKKAWEAIACQLAESN